MAKKKKFGVNEKAAAGRQRKIDQKEAAKASDRKAKEDAKWTDDGVHAKLQRKQAAEAKREEARLKREAKKKLQEEDDKLVAKKVKPPPPKPTKRGILSLQEREKEARLKARDEAELAARQRVLAPTPLEPNINRQLAEEKEALEEAIAAGDVAVATDLTGAISALSVVQHGASAAPAKDRNPERRRKAAYKAFEQEQMEYLRMDYPNLKRSQYKEKIFKMWTEKQKKEAAAAAMAEDE